MNRILEEEDASTELAYSKLVKKANPANDLALSMTALLMKLSGLWLANDRKEECIRRLTLTCTMMGVLFSVWVQFRDLYFSWPNFSDCAYTACNILCMFMVLLKLFVVLIHKKEFIELLAYTYKNIWHVNYDYNELLLLQHCRRISIIYISMVNFCAHGTVVSYVVEPIIANIGRNDSDRVLLFRMWVNFPITVTPTYEIMFAIQVLCVYVVGICYICFDNLLCLLNLHAATQFRILQYRLTNLGDSNTKKPQAEDMLHKTKPDFMKNCYKTFKNCVRQHQSQIVYCHKVNNIFTLIALGHILLFSLLACLVGFQVLLADSPFVRRLLFLFHITGSLCQLLLFTYSCDGLIEESMNIGTAIYCGPWIYLPMDKPGRMLRRDLRMVIIRSRKPCCLTAGAFFPVSLETYTKVLSTAMSYFTLLRQSTE